MGSMSHPTCGMDKATSGVGKERCHVPVQSSAEKACARAVERVWQEGRETRKMVLS